MSRAAKPLLRATKAMQFIFYKHAERRNVYYVYEKPYKIYDLSVFAFITFTFPLNGSTLNGLFFRCNDTIWSFVYRRYTRASINPARLCVRVPLYSFVRGWQCRITLAEISRHPIYRAARQARKLFLAVGHWQERPVTVKACVSIHTWKIDRRLSRCIVYRFRDYSNFSTSHFQGRTSTLEHVFAISCSM